MFVYMLFAISIGIEGGYNIPAVGFQNIHTGTTVSLCADRNMGIVDLTLSVQTSFLTGDNPSYTLNATGLRLGMYKGNWLISPVLAVGGDYINRGLNQSSETGFAAAYTIGALINFKINRLRIYPKVYYDGLTDFKEHAGFLGLRMGIAYGI
ncbi:hypothetical protein AMJ83_07825 [candidate division WOR_3 bacterium SM23_42]|uniref:Outer membrane protein beta-barrel domain-containing protein n=1 Tax=candidate division WOR_3 bacterium SM23_42 TaxID=1703779 RepID=A0A0S8FR86_UNCW3|nr:MAG: hypothetical protein AMJ83_07825 [candidate division WOR_3 bacterium SM23_42]